MTEECSTESSYTILSFPGKELPNQYRNMILAKWLRSLRFGNQLFFEVDPEAYYKNYEFYIWNLMTKPGSIIRLAVLSDDHDVVLGFACSREDVLDYIHVQKDQRMQGIGTKLIPKNITTFTHITKNWIPIWNKKYKSWKFNPFA